MRRRQGNIYLTGFMAAGKTTVGRALASLLGRPFLDLDELVAAAAGVPGSPAGPAEIFAREGEAGFRRRETAALRWVAGRTDGAIVALGGGAVLSPVNRAILRRSGRTVHLEVPLTTVLARLFETPSAPGRPLASDPARVTQLYAERQPIYREAADLTIDAGRGTPEELARQIAGGLTAVDSALVQPGSSRAAGREPPPVRQVPVIVGGRGDTAPQEYLVTVGAGLLSRAASLLPAGLAQRPLALVSNPLVHALHGHQALAGLGGTAVLVPDGESAKSWGQLRRLLEALTVLGLDREGAIAALGGGTVGDLAGFAAAVYLRGLPLVHLPTTLLAMVDSAIGGKNGVNLGTKNRVGTFHQPAAVIADVTALASLPRRQLLSGLAEMVKTGAVAAPEVLAALGSLGDTAAQRLAGDPALATDVVAACAAAKARLVAADERDRGARLALNFGHTVGHALEAATRYRRLTHGEGVALGMVAALRAGVDMGATPPALADDLTGLIGRLGLPVSWSRSLEAAPAFVEAVLAAAAADKKVQAGEIRLVLLAAYGQIVVRPVPPEILRRAVASLF